MLWAFLSIFSGLGDAISYAMIKKLNKLDLYVKLLFYNLITLPFLLVGFLFYEIPAVSNYFYAIVGINVVLWLIAIFLLMKSLQESDLSISIPLLSFTPIFLLFVSYALLGEFPTNLGLIGILIVVFGSYILHISSIKRGYIEPFKSIFKNKGIYMIIAAFLFSITASLAKKGIQLSNPAYFMFIHYLFASIILMILFFNRIKHNKKILKQNFKYILIIGISVASSELLAGAALNSAIVPYVISLKRSNIIFSVILGFFLFKEKNFKEAIIGAIIMFIGAVLITLS